MGVARWIWEMRLGIIYLLLVLVAFNGTTDFLACITQSVKNGNRKMCRSLLKQSFFVFKQLLKLFVGECVGNA